MRRRGLLLCCARGVGSPLSGLRCSSVLVCVCVLADSVPWAPQMVCSQGATACFGACAPPTSALRVFPVSTPTPGLCQVLKFRSQNEDSVDGFGESRYFPSVGSSLSTVPHHLRVSPSLSVVIVAGLSEDRSVTFLVQGPPGYLAVLDAGVNEIVLRSLFLMVPSEHIRVPLICAY